MVIRGGFGRSFDIGVFGTVFGHTVTQNIPVLAVQNLNAASNTAESLIFRKDRRLRPDFLESRPCRINVRQQDVFRTQQFLQMEDSFCLMELRSDL